MLTYVAHTAGQKVAIAILALVDAVSVGYTLKAVAQFFGAGA